MHLTCPHCAQRLELEAAVEDECARDFVRALRRAGAAAPHAVGYVMLFKPRVRSLRWSRALALMGELLDLIGAHGETAVAAALGETIASLQPKQGTGWQPLTSHRYLLRVLASVAERGTGLAVSEALNADKKALQPTSKTARAMMALREPDRG